MSTMYQHFLTASQRAPSALTASFSAKGVTRLILMVVIIRSVCKARQWVLSVPKRLRCFMQRDRAVLNMVLRERAALHRCHQQALGFRG